LHRFATPTPGDLVTVANAGDVDRDGFEDVLMTIGRSGSDFRVELRSGHTGTLLRAWDAPPSLSFQFHMAGGTDADGDGHDDFLLAGRSATGTYVELYSGKSLAVVFLVRGEKPDDAFGSSLAFAGDWDQDGVVDVAIGTSSVPFGPSYTRVVSGKDGKTLRTFLAEGQQDRFGAALANLGDTDRDGRDDLVVAAPTYVHVYSSRTQQRLLRIDSSQFNGLARSVAAIGDVNHDGSADWLVSIPGRHRGPTDLGRV
jgi:hypothetical protein